MTPWPYWWTMPVLLFSGIVGPGVDVTAIPALPTIAGVIIAGAVAASWVVLTVAGVIAALWVLDTALDLIAEYRRHAR